MWTLNVRGTVTMGSHGRQPLGVKLIRISDVLGG